MLPVKRMGSEAVGDLTEIASMSLNAASPGALRFAPSLAETRRFWATVVIWFGGTVKVGPTCLTWQQTESGTVGLVVATRPTVNTTTSIGPGFGIAGRVTLVIVPAPPVAGIGTRSVPAPMLFQVHMHDGEPTVPVGIRLGAPSEQLRPGVIACAGSPPKAVSASA